MAADAFEAHLAQLYQPNFAGKKQYLHKERRQLLKKAFAKRGDGVVVGMGIGGSKPESNGIKGGPFNLPAGKYTVGVSVEQ